MAIKLVTLPPTAFGAELDCGINADLRAVFRPSERNPDFYTYHDLWFPEEEYPDGYIAVPVTSILSGKRTFNAGTVFANAEGSTFDPKPYYDRPYSSWRQLMIALGIEYSTCCAERNRIYYSTTQETVTDFLCTNNGQENPAARIWIQGAHVLMGEISSRKPPEGSMVYLLPLCISHNTYRRINGKTGAGYYMKLGRNQKVIVLDGFIPSRTVQDAILREELYMENLQTAEKPKLSVGLEFMFMGVDLGAYYIKKDDGYQIFAAPMDIDNKAEISLQDMVDQFNKLTKLQGEDMLTTDKVISEIKSGENVDKATNIDLTSIKFRLKMLFLNINSTKTEKTTEYALSLEIIADGLIPSDIEIFNVKRLSFNIWNTARPKVLDKMALTMPEEF